MSEAMDEAKYQALLAQLRADWGRLGVDPDQPGVLRAKFDPTTGILAGIRSRLFAEIINRAMEPEGERRPVAPPADQSDAEFLRYLAERLRHVPAIFGTDQGDIDRLIEIAGAAT